MRDVNWGWLLRYTHAERRLDVLHRGLSSTWLRGLYYGSYKAPREVLWILGVVISCLMMATAFHGLHTALGPDELLGRHRYHQPLLGDPACRHIDCRAWLWGGYSVSDTTLNRMYLAALPDAVRDRRRCDPSHLGAARGRQQQPDRDRSQAGLGRGSIPPLLHRSKTCFALAIFAIFSPGSSSTQPNYLGHADNYIEANPLATPAHIVPEWYFLPFYAILRAIPDKLLGVVAMFASIAILFFIPWLDTSRVRSAKYRPIYKWFFWLLMIVCCVLGYLGAKPPEGAYLFWGRVCTAWYFIHFLVIMPFVGIIERPGNLPNSITESVLGTGKAAEGGGGADTAPAAAAPETR